MKYTIHLSLSKPSTTGVSMDIEGTRLSAELGSSTLTALDVEAANANEATERAHRLADLFLDYVSIKYGFTAAVHDDLCRAEWNDPATGQTRKAVNVRIEDTSVVHCRLQLHDENGNTVYDSDVPGHVPYAHMDAMAYVRKARLTADIFESYRNYHLAAENAASILSPRPVPPVGCDKAIFMHGVRHVFAANSAELSQIVAPLMGQATPNAEDIGRFLYEDYRCVLDHSKGGLPKKMPFNPADEASVRTALPAIELIALRLIEAAT
jgi:hypothetical protein